MTNSNRNNQQQSAQVTNPMVFFDLIADTFDAEIAGLIQFLEPNLADLVIRQRITAMRTEGTQFFGVSYRNDTGRALMGTAAMSYRTHCFAGKVAFVENVVLLPMQRQSGLGEQFMRWLEQIAWQQGCQMVTLDSYQRNTRACAFYERLGYDPRGVHFVLERPQNLSTT